MKGLYLRPTRLHCQAPQAVTFVYNLHTPHTNNAETQDRTGDLQIFSLTLSQLSYGGQCEVAFHLHCCHRNSHTAMYAAQDPRVTGSNPALCRATPHLPPLHTSHHPQGTENVHGSGEGGWAGALPAPFFLPFRHRDSNPARSGESRVS